MAILCLVPFHPSVNMATEDDAFTLVVDTVIVGPDGPSWPRALDRLIALDHAGLGLDRETGVLINKDFFP